MKTTKTQKPPFPVRGDRRAFSLIEAVISFAIIGIVGTGIGLAVLQQRRLAESNVFETTALTVAQGFVEQIKTMDYNAVAGCAYDPDTNPTPSPLPVLGIKPDVDGTTDFVTQPLVMEARNEIGVVENGKWMGILYDIVRDTNDPSNGKPRYMRVWATPRIRRVTDIDDRNLNAYEITIEYEWDARDISPTATPRKAFVRTVRSDVPSF